MLASQAAPRLSKSPNVGGGTGERATWASQTCQSLRHRPAPVDVDLSMASTGSYAGMPHSSDSVMLGMQSHRKDRAKPSSSGILARLAVQTSTQDGERPKAPAFDVPSPSRSTSSQALRRRPSQSSIAAAAHNKPGGQTGRDRNVSFNPEPSEDLEPLRPGSFESRSFNGSFPGPDLTLEELSPSRSSVALPRVSSCKSMNGVNSAADRRAVLGGLSSKSSGMLPSAAFDIGPPTSPSASFPATSGGNGSGNNLVGASTSSSGAMGSTSSNGRPTLKLLPGDLKLEDRKAPSPSGTSGRSMSKTGVLGSRTLSSGSLRYPSLKAPTMDERTISNASTTIVDSRPGTPIDSGIDRSRLASDWFDGPMGASPSAPSASSGLTSTQLLGRSSCAGAGRSSLAGTFDQLGGTSNLGASQGFDKSAALLVLNGLSQTTGNSRSSTAAPTGLTMTPSSSTSGLNGASLMPLQGANTSASFSSTCPLGMKGDSKDWEWASSLDQTCKSMKELKAVPVPPAVQPLSHRMLAAVAALEQNEGVQGNSKVQPVRAQKLIQELKEGEKIYDLYFLDEVLQEEGNGGKVVICRAKEGEDSDVQLVMKIRRKKDLANQGLEEQFRKAQVKVMNLPRHPGILPVHALYEDDKYYYVVMTKADEPSFFSSLLSDFGDGCMPDHAVQRLMRELLEAVDHVHRHGMLHRDLKPDNIVMHTGPKATPDELVPAKRAMLIDFDHADADWDPASDKNCGDVNDVFGTLRFSAPEALQGQFSAQSDLYSIGTILYLLITGSFPFPEELYAGVADGQTWTTPCRRKEIYERQRTFKIDFSSAAWSGKVECKDLCAALLAFDPEERPFTAREALRHRWFRPGPWLPHKSERPNRRFQTR